MEEVRSSPTWNKKKILVAIALIILLVIGGYFFKTKILGSEASSLNQPGSVKGSSSVQENDNGNDDKGFNIKETVKEKINNLKQQVSGLDIVEIASSSPQVKKILNDIKSLEQYPVNQARDMCKKICESF